jgi:hypothetical protein
LKKKKKKKKKKTQSRKQSRKQSAAETRRSGAGERSHLSLSQSL